MTITKITDHVSQAQARMLSQYADKTIFKDLIEVLCNGIQTLEDYIYEFYGLLDIDTAHNSWLDLIGEIVGQPRYNTTDEIYRALIRAKIGQNSSDGTYEYIMSIFKILTGSVTVKLTELDYASIAIWSETEAPASIQSLIYGFIDSAVAGGVEVAEVGVYDDMEPFGFVSTTMGSLDIYGFGSITGGEANGGKLGKIY